MKFGVCIPNYGETCSTDAVEKIALEAETIGFDSVWCTDHLLMPRNSNTPYERIFESITCLAYLAGITRRIRLGISSLITAMRNPVVVAKQLATIDNLSRGRLVLATSAGWNDTEFSFLGSSFHNRGKRLDESIRLIRTLWKGETDFESNILRQKFRDVVFEPRPIQKSLPIWIGGASKAAMKRAATLGDAWHPNVQPLDEFSKLVSEFRTSFSGAKGKEICARIGLNVNTDKSEYLSPQGQRRILFSANQEENLQILDELRALGVSYLVVALSSSGKSTVSDQLEGLEMLSKYFPCW